jgi:hypothetical protein
VTDQGGTRKLAGPYPYPYRTTTMACEEAYLKIYEIHGILYFMLYVFPCVRGFDPWRGFMTLI